MGPALEVTPEQSSTVSQPHHSGEVISRCRRGVPQRELMQPSVDHAAIGGSWHDAAVMATVGGLGEVHTLKSKLGDIWCISGRACGEGGLAGRVG